MTTRVGHNGGVNDATMLPVVEPPVACSLGTAELTDRLAEWRRVLAGATGRVHGVGPHDVVLRLGPETSAAELAALCAEEVACCPFFAFDLTIDVNGLQLRVAVPVGAEAVLADFAGLLPGPVRAGST